MFFKNVYYLARYSKWSNNLVENELQGIHADGLWKNLIDLVIPGLFNEFFLNMTSASNDHGLGHLVI